MNKEKIILVYITNPNLSTAKKVVTHLLKKRLIACANFWPVSSAYWWQSKITNGKEVVILAKTTLSNWNKIKTEIKTIHPYSVPCVIKLSAKANVEFGEWIMKNVDKN